MTIRLLLTSFVFTLVCAKFVTNEYIPKLIFLYNIVFTILFLLMFCCAIALFTHGVDYVFRGKLNAVRFLNRTSSDYTKWARRLIFLIGCFFSLLTDNMYSFFILLCIYIEGIIFIKLVDLKM